MKTGTASTLLTRPNLRPEPGFVHSVNAKHEPQTGVLPVLRLEASYPSPPMSNPPSPPRQTHGSTTVSSTYEEPSSASIAASTVAPPPACMPDATVAPPLLGPHLYQPTSYTLPTATSTIQLSPRYTSALSISTQRSATSGTLTGVHSTGARSGRKSKAHVASACINCKRAHLSCDVNRPCARCVASGKQDTCFDVQHKKRGRPRLREETDFKAEQTLLESGASSAVPTPNSEIASRTIASTRHRRQESFRSLRSQGSDTSAVASSPTYPHPPPPTVTDAFLGARLKPQFSTIPPWYEVPTAYLNLDLVIIKANRSYRQIMLGGAEVAGRQIAEIAAPIDGESFANIRNRLRSEREAHDPAYMPPIMHPGHDPLQGAREAEVERYAQGFQDRTYTWTQTQAGSSAQTFPVRVRLAKANTYFVAVTLPSFRPVEAVGQSQMPRAFIGSASPPGIDFRARQPVAASAPFPPVVAPTLQTGQPSSSRASWPRPPPVLDQHLQGPVRSYQADPRGASRLPVAEPPTETTAFTPRTAARELGQESASGPQLPPIVGSPVPVSSRTMESSDARATAMSRSGHNDTDVDEGERTPRKRRRLGLDDVLHR